MSAYYVNKNAQANGDHEVHKEGCSYVPQAWNAEYLGEFTTCYGAVTEARRRGYLMADGCAHCCPLCHSS